MRVPQAPLMQEDKYVKDSTIYSAPKLIHEVVLRDVLEISAEDEDAIMTELSISNSGADFHESMDMLKRRFSGSRAKLVEETRKKILGR